mgnify:CR=1 FL=1
MDSWQVDRDEFYSELILREHIRDLIMIAKTKREKLTEKKTSEISGLKTIIESLAKEVMAEAASTEPDPKEKLEWHMKILDKLLNEIVPQIENFIRLLSSDEQRQSLRANYIHGVQDVISTVLPSGVPSPNAELGPTDELQEELEMDVSEEDPEKYMPLEDEEKEEAEEQPAEKELRYDLEQYREIDKTGQGALQANAALDATENQIVDAYTQVLKDQSDDAARTQSQYYDYLITNLKLHMDRIINRITGKSPEPTTPSYEKEKKELDAAEDAGALDSDEVSGFDELEKMFEVDSDFLKSLL